MTETTPLFEKLIEVRWSDCDLNKHMRHSAYSDFCAHTRVSYLFSAGMNDDWFKEHNLSPVMFKEQTEYFAEVFLGEQLKVTVEHAESTGSDKSIAIVNNIYKADGTLAAAHKVVVGWMDMKLRKIAPLPDLIRKNMY